MPVTKTVGDQVIGAFRRLLLAASGEAPTLLLVDDAHLMGDADTDARLEIAVTGRPVHVALASRTLAADSTLGRGMSRLVAAGRLVAIDLAPLADEEAKSLIEQAR